MEVDTLVFDIDDTMYPVSSGFSDHRIELCIQKFMPERLGLQSVEEARAIWKEYFEKTHATMKALAVADQDGRLPKTFVQDELASFWADQCEHAEFLKPNPAFQEALEKLAAKGLKLAVFTNSPKKYALRCLDTMDVRRFFPDECIFSVQETWPACKPEALAFEKVFAALGSDARRSVMFEDSMKNVRGAKALGMGTVFIDESLSKGSSRQETSLEGEKDSSSDDPHVDIAMSSIVDIEARIPELFIDPPRFPCKS